MNIFFLITGICFTVTGISYFQVSKKVKNVYDSLDEHPEGSEQKLKESIGNTEAKALSLILLGIAIMIIELIKYYLNF